MATLTTKFSIGDTSWCTEVWTDRDRIECPDCLGQKTWACTLPNGEQESIECPSCRGNGWIGEYGSRGDVRLLTIGDVEFDRDGPRYMCNETGVSSGRVYRERDLFGTEAEARASLAGKLEEAKRIAAEFGLNEYLKNRERNVGNMTGYYRKEIREAKKKLKAAEEGLARIRGK